MNQSSSSAQGAQGLTAADPRESDWIRSAREGDRRAFERLYRLHAGRVYALCLRMASDPQRAEILAQDAFVRAWTKLKAYDARGPFGAWLRRLAVNVVIESGRSESRRGRLHVSEAELGGSDGAQNLRLTRAPAGGDSPTELGMDLERAIAALPEGARQIFVLHDVEGFRQREIAEMTDLALGTVKSQLHRARRLLREKLAPFAEGSES